MAFTDKLMRCLMPVACMLVICVAGIRAQEPYIAADRVEYTIGETTLNGGFGWSGPWQNAVLVSPSLAYQGIENAGTLHLASVNGAIVSRQLAVPVTKAWLAMLVQTTYDPSPAPLPLAYIRLLLNAQQVVQLETTPAGQWQLNNGTTQVSTGQTAPGAVRLIVFELTDTQFKVYFNPAIGADPPTGGTAIAPANNLPVSFNNIQIMGTADLRVDEIVIAHSYAALWEKKAYVTVEAFDAIAAEGLAGGLNAGVFRFSRSGTLPISQPLSVRVGWSGTATPGVDYQPLPHTVTIPPNQYTVDVVVTPIDDQLAEGNETVIATILPDGGYVVGTPSSATVTIFDDDMAAPQVTLQLIDGTAAEGDPANPASFRVTRVGAYPHPLRVYLEYGGTAALAYDVEELPTHVDLPGGGNEASVVVQVVPIDDFLVEGTETVTVKIKPDGAYTATGTTLSINIFDNDQNITISLVAIDQLAGEAGWNTARYLVRRQGYTEADIPVQFSYGGTAVYGLDYAPLPFTIVVPGGGDRNDVEMFLRVIDDHEPEPTESVVITLIEDGQYAVAEPSSLVLQIVDNDSVPTVFLQVLDGVMVEENGLDTARVAVRRLMPGTAPLRVRLQYAGTALPGVDYRMPPTEVVIPAGATEYVLELVAIDDQRHEGVEYATIAVMPDAAYTIGSPSTVTVQVVETGNETLGGIMAVKGSGSDGGCGSGALAVMLTTAGGWWLLRRRTIRH